MDVGARQVHEQEIHDPGACISVLPRCDHAPVPIQCAVDLNPSLYLMCYAEACNEFAVPISVSLRLGNTALFEEMLQQWQAVGNTVSDLTGPRFEPLTSRCQRRTHSTKWPV